MTAGALFLLGYLLGAFATFWALCLYFHDRVRRAEQAAEVWEEATTELIDDMRSQPKWAAVRRPQERLPKWN